MACVLYHEDKLLLTNEDFVPVIEIDETFTSNLHTDFYWLMKVRTRPGRGRTGMTPQPDGTGS